jgi:hypothetical protein
MSSEANRLQLDSLVLEPIGMTPPWQAYRFKLAVPLTSEHHSWVVSFVERLMEIVSRQYRLQPSLWLDTAELHREGGARLLSSHVRQWSPQMGFGFDPTGPSPRTLEFSDLTDATFGSPPKIFDRSAIFVSSLEATQSAYRLLAGRGLATLLFFPGDGPADAQTLRSIKYFMENSRLILEPMINSPMFHNHPFYLPLLSSTGIANASSQQLENWLGGAELLWRENCDDEELLLLSVRDLAGVFEEAGMCRLSHAEGAVPWSIAPINAKEINL